MIYNFNLGIGWASSGVEYAQAYRARILRDIGQPAKFIFTDMFPREALLPMTRNIGIRDEEVMWLYTFFTDCELSAVSYTTEQLEQSFGDRPFTRERKGKTIRYLFENSQNFYTAYLTEDGGELVHRVELVSAGCLIRKDYFTNRKNYSEYYAPLNGQAKLYYRRYFNRDGSTAYEEMVGEKDSVFRFPDRLIFSKEDLIGYMVSKLSLTKEDVVIIDRSTGQGQAILENSGPARVGVVIHAEHYSESNTDEDTILWNNYYEYMFAQDRHIDFYISSTEAQSEILRRQFRKYKGREPFAVTIPVGGLPELKRPEGKRRPHSLITASRLAPEKHVDWIVEAVAQVHRQIPDLSLDIYGEGQEEERLRNKIQELEAGDYIHLLGQHNMEEVYKDYEVYVAGSTSEGFGLTLMEAVGSGLPIIGFDVHYGNQTFIEDGKSGYLLPVWEDMDGKDRVRLLAEAIYRIFTQADLETFHENAYGKAKNYMSNEVGKQWEKLLCMRK